MQCSLCRKDIPSITSVPNGTQCIMCETCGKRYTQPYRPTNKVDAKDADSNRLDRRILAELDATRISESPRSGTKNNEPHVPMKPNESEKL